MDARQQAILRRELIGRITAIYRKVRSELAEETVAAAIERDPEDEAEDAAEDELTALRNLLDDRDTELLHRCEDALARMRAGTYGYCIECGEPIPFQRLVAVPWAERCAVDEARVERTPPPTL